MGASCVYVKEISHPHTIILVRMTRCVNHFLGAESKLLHSGVQTVCTELIRLNPCRIALEGKGAGSVANWILRQPGAFGGMWKSRPSSIRGLPGTQGHGVGSECRRLHTGA